MRRLFILRPEPGASASVERARALGLDAVAVPLFAVTAVAWGAPEAARFDGLLLTSANAARHSGDAIERLRGLKVYAVGEATADAAREAGFAIAATGDADAPGLLGSIAPDLRLLHLCGADRRRVEDAAQSITPVVVYRADAIDTPMLGGLAGQVAAVHSPRAAGRLAELVEQGSSIRIAAISASAAEAAGTGWERIETAAAPNDSALLALAARLCDKSGQQ